MNDMGIDSFIWISQNCMGSHSLVFVTVEKPMHPDVWLWLPSQFETFGAEVSIGSLSFGYAWPTFEL